MRLEARYKRLASGSKAAPPQLAPPPQPGTTKLPCSDGGRNNGPMRTSARRFNARSRSLGVKSIRSSSLTPCSSNGGGQVGNGCVGDACSPSKSLFGTGRSSMGHSGVPVTRSKTYRKPTLLTCTTARTGLPFWIRSTTTGAAGRS